MLLSTQMTTPGSGRVSAAECRRVERLWHNESRRKPPTPHQSRMSYGQQARVKASAVKSCVTWISVDLRFCLPNECEQGSCGTSKCFFKCDVTATAQRKVVSTSQWKRRCATSMQRLAVYCNEAQTAGFVSRDLESKSIYRLNGSILLHLYTQENVHPQFIKGVVNINPLTKNE